MNENKNENLTDIEEKKETSPKEIQVITGNGELMISPVYEHLEVENPRKKDDRAIVVPKVKGTQKKEEDANLISKEENKEA